MIQNPSDWKNLVPERDTVSFVKHLEAGSGDNRCRPNVIPSNELTSVKTLSIHQTEEMDGKLIHLSIKIEYF